MNTIYLPEIKALCNMLLMAGIPFSFDRISPMEGFHVCYPSSNDVVCSIICHKSSYGHEKGLLEIMGLVGIKYDMVEGYLTAEEVFKRIQNHWESSEDHNRNKFVSFREDKK